LLREGASVVINGRTQERVGAALKGLKGDVRGVAADAGTAEGVARLIEAAPDLDILVNNVGIFAAVPFERIDDAQWQRIFEVNVLSGARLSRHHFPRMLRRNFGR